MNGNNPYGGPAGPTDAARAELSVDQQRRLRRAVAGIVARTESYLPDGYRVGSELSGGTDGPQARVAVEPPAGRPVSAGLTPDPEDLDAGLDEADRIEVAQGLAASAALQAMAAVDSSEFTPTAR